LSGLVLMAAPEGECADAICPVVGKSTVKEIERAHVKGSAVTTYLNSQCKGVAQSVIVIQTRNNGRRSNVPAKATLADSPSQSSSTVA
jgi:hypothetical protein